MKRSLIAFSLFLTAPFLPLKAEELYEEKEVCQIEVVLEDFSGEQEVIDPKPILSQMKTKEGDLFSQLTFDSDLKTLSKEYERIAPALKLKEGKLSIALHLTARPVIHQIRWEGNEKVSRSSLQKELGVEPNTTFSRHDFNKAFSKLKEYYFKKGYFESQLSYRLEPIDESHEIDIVIKIVEGRAGYIQSVELNGFTKEEKSEITSQMYLKKYNFLTSWYTGHGTYRDELLQQDQMSILTHLQNEGYADAKVDVALDEDLETKKLIISITAHRGPCYHIGKVRYEGNALFSTEELINKSQIEEGTIFSPEKLREASLILKNLYGQKGYIDASVQYETILKSDAPEFDLVFTIEEGLPYKVGLIHIFGNSSTKNNVILRESLLVPGETFDARKLKATQQRLEAMGYFKSVNVFAVRPGEEKPQEQECQRDVYIEVEEASTGNISLFLGFSSMDDIYGGLDLTERNFNIAGLSKAFGGQISALRGGGQFFHIRGTAGKKQSNVLLSWMNPYLNDSLWRFGFDLSYTYSRLQKNTKVTTYGGSVYTNYPLTNYWTVGMRQRMRHSKDFLDLDPLEDNEIAKASLETVRRNLDQKGLVSAFSGNLAYDSTDNPFKPHRGWRSFLEAEVAGLGGKYDFFKLSYLNALYFPLWCKATFKIRGDFKYIVPFGDTKKAKVPYSERLFLGGESTVRGYKPYLLGPVVELDDGTNGIQKTDTPFGGLSASLLSLEINQEIFHMLDIFAFFDVGSCELNSFEIHKIRPSTGVGARIDLGNRVPIVLGWGYPLVEKDRQNKKWEKFFFSMGGQF